MVRSFVHSVIRSSPGSRQLSEFHAPLSLDALLQGMLDGLHLGHQIGQLDQGLWRVAAGDDQVQGRIALGQRLDRKSVV